MEKHPRFRALSWVSRSTKSADDIIRDSNLRSFLTSIWRECSSQLEAIHLDTALDYSPLLDQQDFGQVTKLRIRGSTLSVDVCQRLLKALRLAGCIITLELPALPNDRLWRRMRVLDSVRHLWFAPYMGKRVSLLEVLQLVASKTPNLQQLVIEIDLSNRAEMTYLSEVRDGTINTFMTTQTLQRWSLEDFGVTWKNGDDVVLMKAILRAVKILVPSLYSFYGTGTLDTPLEEDFTGNWFGLWKGAI
ncbi:hypothetical protein DL96DRAFT_1687985 [Flagelloscypha sp. PMI_526]|nr:hypothetical protein DL96DRAFT_1687985 [Flagelloscypha sp. PMI_526]